MMDERTYDLAVLYVFGELSAEEKTAFESRLYADAEMQTEVRELRETTGSLAALLPPVAPPDSVKQAVLREIQPVPIEQPPMQNAARFVWIPWAIAAIFLICASLLFFEWSALSHKMSQTQASEKFAKLDLKVLQATKAGTPNSIVLVAWNEKAQTGTLKVSNLPPPPANHDYQLWIIDPAEKAPISAGVIRTSFKTPKEVRFHPVQPVKEAANFAISVERKGGVPHAKGPIVMVGK